MIYLKTGQPGHGKTLRAIWQALEFVKEGRPVYANGVRGLKYDEAGFIELKDPTRWMDCPPGSVILLDECYRVFPKRSAASKVPEHVERMAIHRHDGYDFILVCQSPSKQIDPFLHDLVDHHEHIRRKFGMKKAVVLWWDRYMSNVKDSNTKKLWSYPKELLRRNLYVSTEQDTTERRIPWFVYALPITIAVLCLLLWRAYAWLHPEPKAQVGAPGATQPGAQAAQFPGQQQAPLQRPADLVKWLKPRIPGEPWSAPAYDGRAVASNPEVYCVAADTGDCRCITEQGTRYELDVKVCRAIARDGAYNPTRAPVAVAEGRGATPVAPSPSGAAATDAQSGQGSAGSPWPQGGLSQAYVPPDLLSRPSASAASGGHY